MLNDAVGGRRTSFLVAFWPPELQTDDPIKVLCILDVVPFHVTVFIAM